MTKNENVFRVRFAPSPTGGLHPGNARIAVFNWLFAKHNNARYVLRIEDTDAERSTQEFEDAIISDLKWLGVNWDEGPYRQSERSKRYKDVAAELFEKGFLYKCYCTDEELKAERSMQIKAGLPPRYEGKCKGIKENRIEPYALRFDVDKFKSMKNISFHDVIKKMDISVNVDVIGDFVVMKREGTPTYNFAVVVDDIDMKITHVFRGEDHVPNTARQLMVYMALGRESGEWPVFGHLPMLLAPDKSKLSKRSGGIPIHEYKSQGFLSDAMFNHLAMLGGGSFSEMSDTASKDELVKAFDHTHTASSSCVYDIEKLRSVNSKMIHSKRPEEVLDLLSHDMNYSDDWTKYYSDQDFCKAVAVAKEGAHTLPDIIETLKVFLPHDMDENIYKKFNEDQKKVFNYVEKNFSGNDWNALKEKAANGTGISGGKLFKTLRLIFTGRESGPPMDEIMNIINKELAKKRVSAIKVILV